MDEDFKKLCAIIADVLGIDPDEITMDTTFDEDLGADSLDVASIIMGIEDEYDVKVDTEVAAKVTTVGEALARKYTVIRITKGWSSSEMLFLRWSPALFCIMNTPIKERES